MEPNCLSQALSLLGIALYAYFLWFRPSQEGIALGLGLALGGAAFGYGEKPFPVPFFLGLFALLGLLQVFYGHPLFFLLGGLVGMGAPYLAYRLRKPAK
jgi:hypothetical protein